MMIVRQVLDLFHHLFEFLHITDHDCEDSDPYKLKRSTQSHLLSQLLLHILVCLSKIIHVLLNKLPILFRNVERLNERMSISDLDSEED